MVLILLQSANQTITPSKAQRKLDGNIISENLEYLKKAPTVFFGLGLYLLKSKLRIEKDLRFLRDSPFLCKLRTFSLICVSF